NAWRARTSACARTVPAGGCSPPTPPVTWSRSRWAPGCVVWRPPARWCSGVRSAELGAPWCPAPSWLMSDGGRLWLVLRAARTSAAVAGYARERYRDREWGDEHVREPDVRPVRGAW